MSYTLPEFLAHAIAMENEAAERYLELADMMEAHQNQEVSSVFRDMHRFSVLHRDSITESGSGIELPQMKSWQFRWTSPPEVADEEAFDYTLTPYQALLYARENEMRARDFYQSIADSSGDAEIIRMATEFAQEESEHTEALDDWILRTPQP